VGGEGKNVGTGAKAVEKKGGEMETWREGGEGVGEGEERKGRGRGRMEGEK